MHTTDLVRLTLNSILAHRMRSVLTALGIGIGSLLSGRLSGRNVEFGVVPLGALGLALCTCGLFLLPDSLSS